MRVQASGGGGGNSHATCRLDLFFFSQHITNMLPIYGECCQNPGSDSQNQQKKKNQKKQQKRNQGKNAKEQPVISARVSVPHIVVMGEGGGVHAGAAA